MPSADTAPAPAAAGPAPPPPGGPDNMADFLADLNRQPLFMTTLDDTDGAGGPNTQLDALRAIAYDGTPADVADNFRAQGNECARSRRWADARAFYTQALDALAGKTTRAVPPPDEDAAGSLRRRLEGLDVGEREVDWLDGGGAGEERVVVDVDEEERRQRELGEVCAVNRALCNLELKNYGQAARDCAHALEINPKNIKAYYRSATALLAIDKIPSALQATRLGLQHDPANAALQALVERAQERLIVLEKVEVERRERLQRRAMETATLKAAFKSRGIALVGSKDDAPDMEDAKVALEEPLDPDSELRTPLLLLYPTAGQSELVKEVRESESIRDVLGMVLPVPWEGGEEFGGGEGEGVECFVETGAGGLRKVGKKVQWGRVLKDGGCVVRDGMCRAFVVPTGKVDGWIHEYKKRAGKG